MLCPSAGAQAWTIHECHLKGKTYTGQGQLPRFNLNNGMYYLPTPSLQAAAT